MGSFPTVTVGAGEGEPGHGCGEGKQETEETRAGGERKVLEVRCHQAALQGNAGNGKVEMFF